MQDPWSVLKLDPNSDEATIRKRYLELVRDNPPDRNPARFQQIHDAYELARDPLKRLNASLFLEEIKDPLEDIISDLTRKVRETRLPTEALLRLVEAT